MFPDLQEAPAELRVGIEALVKEQLKGDGFSSGSARKDAAKRRERIIAEKFQPDILDKLSATYYNKEVKLRMANHVSVVVNLGADVTRALACVYKQQPKRSFDGGSEEANRALLELNQKTRRASKSEKINQLAWFAGPVLEMPIVRDGVMNLHLFPCSCIDVQVSDDDPLGHPIAAAYPWFEDGEKVIKVVDEADIYTYNKAGELLRQEPHQVKGPDGKDRFPGTLWRFDDPTDINDYFSKDRNERLVDATIDCGVIYTAMDWVRHSQNRKLMVAIGSMKGLAAGSSTDPETPVFWDVADEDAMPQFNVADLNQPIGDFVSQIQFISKIQVRAHGIPDSALTFDFDQGGDMAVMALSLQHDQLTQLRNKQIRFAEECELRSQYNLCALAKANGLGDDLPELPVIAETLEIEFSDLTRIEDPATKQAELDWKLKRGHTTDAHIYCDAHPGCTLEEAKAAVIENLEMQAEFNELKAERNLDPAAEMLDGNEATGGMRSDPEPEEDENQ